MSLSANAQSTRQCVSQEVTSSSSPFRRRQRLQESLRKGYLGDLYEELSSTPELLLLVLLLTDKMARNNFVVGIVQGTFPDSFGSGKVCFLIASL